MIDWTPRTIRWFETAATYTGYADKLADMIYARIRKKDSLCDIGCGTAMADFALQQRIGHITCVDRDARVIAHVAARIQQENILGMQAVAMEGAALQGAWDTVLCIFHGDMETVVDCYLPLATDTLIAVVHNRRVGNLAPKEQGMKKCSSVEETARYLKRRGIQYDLYQDALEYGQPLKDWQEAEMFLRTYSKQDMPQETLQKDLKERLQQTGRSDFPLYLPSLKEFGIFTIRRA